MVKEFRDFLLRGNIVELAVAFVLGVAFGALINSFVDNLLMPVVAMIIGKPDFRALTFTINDSVFRYGAFLTDLIAFAAIAAAVFFFVVKHAEATHATVTIGCVDDVVRVEIRDDGAGGANTSAGSGLIGLRDRAEAAGGTLVVVSPAGRGTVVTASLPRSS